uniref:ABC transporter domain-containing protein n=1 Tax=Setaria italica TaxID=4555 RepID=K4A4V9_SETIT
MLLDSSKLGALKRREFFDNLVKCVEDDNLQFLQRQKDRIERVGLKLPTIEVKYENLCVEAESRYSGGNHLPTIWNSIKGVFSGPIRLFGSKSNNKVKINILEDVSGIIKPCRLTLLLGPPGCGKSTLLRALAGQLDKSLKVTGDISYNGYRLDEFVPEKTAAYISQYDLHIPDMTVRETLDFSARCQGVGSRAEILKEVKKREKVAGIIPDHDIDLYMKATITGATEKSLQTDYILKIMGLDICADTMVGDAMRRGISGGQKKRLTTAEMIVGPSKAFFMDEISNGLDSSTTFRIIKCFQQLANINECTMLISLLQPTPEVFDLFDDLILMAQGKIIYHGPRNEAHNFFEECGFRCPERKGMADFLQEVLSRKDQRQYWSGTDESYRYISSDKLSSMFEKYQKRRKLEEATVPHKSELDKESLSFNKYSLPKLELLKACGAREALLIKRNMFVYAFKTVQLSVIAVITMSVFFRTHMTTDLTHANYYMGALYYSMLLLVLNGLPEMSMQVARLPSFYKQKRYYFYPSWAYAIPASILKVPISLLDSIVWICITYYGIGYTATASRFFCQFLILCLLHQSVSSSYRFIASYAQTHILTFFYQFISLAVFLVFGGFVLSKSSMPGWLSWGFWISPLAYAQISMAINEFLAPRWQKETMQTKTIGNQILTNHGLYYNWYFYWISVGALLGYIILFYIAFGLALAYRKRKFTTKTIEYNGSIPRKCCINGQEEEIDIHKKSNDRANMTQEAKMVMPTMQLALTFRNLNYYVDTPKEMLKQGYPARRIQLLNSVTGVFRPGVLTALMGVSGAGKTTLLDVLAGRKTGGYIEGDIRIGGRTKVQETFVRILGYCEQVDMHSPQLTVEESVAYSAWLRLPSKVDEKTKSEFVDEVLKTVELDEIKDALVGRPGMNGLSLEQRKRLTVAVELVSNPSIILMDEPTTGLDARSAAIVIRAVKNISEKGRTVVCTIHQPSTDIFEAFDELILMKNGGKIIYNGPIGKQSCKVIEYFEKISGVPKVERNRNPATWMMDITSPSMEVQFNIDFASTYQESPLHRDRQELVKQLSSPLQNSDGLYFTYRFPQNGWGQFKACLWKQNIIYWRSPQYNLNRMVMTVMLALIFGALFWRRAKILNNEQDLFNVLGAMYMGVIQLGVYNEHSIISFSTTERIVMYREKFAGMYSSWAYSLAQAAIEIPYVFIQAILYTFITYPTIGYYWTAYKLLLFFYAIFCSVLSYIYVGLLLVSVTPNVQVATILGTFFNTMQTLFSGFILPAHQMPKWWIWLYYLGPTSWILNAQLTSQYGNIGKEVNVFGETKTVAVFLNDYFGFHQDRLSIVATVITAFPIVVIILYTLSVEKLNFQKR